MWLLESQELSVGEIAERIDASIQNTSQHLRLMRDRGILASRRAGQTIFYRIKDDAFGNHCKMIINTIKLDQG